MDIKYLLIASPDKISLSSFIKFIKKYFNYPVGTLHNLMTNESLNTYIDDFSLKFSKGILSFYAKRLVNVDPSTCLPGEVFKKADIIVWFDLYSLVPKILKDQNNQLKVILEDWNQYIRLLSE